MPSKRGFLQLTGRVLFSAAALALAVKQADEYERPGFIAKRGKGQRKKNKSNRWG